MHLLNPAAWAGLFSALAAALHWILASRRDLGPLPLGLAGVALVLGGGEGPLLAAELVLAALLAAAGWHRASRAGVARPGAAGLSLAVVAAAVTTPWWGLPVDPEGLRAVALVPCAMVSALGTVLALEQLPPVRRRPPSRKIPVE
ncbi:MAG: hypothetical protein JXX28_10170 [Deltaproteobacteria bacterium]|nr:hypothetical protein [Deltaproteobacteria bacterium]